ncbi:MAG: sugar ABC transporter ATP-binding protein [Planctomycetota bacterium]
MSTTAAPPEPWLLVRGAGKSFPGVRALDDVDFAVGAGEVVAVVGENGAGKSTLMKVLAGVQRLDQGEVLVDGRPVAFDSVAAAQRQGIALIHQELNLCSNLSVGANVMLGHEPRTGPFLRDRALLARARVALDRVGLSVDPRRPLADLSIGQQQRVEIAKALSVDARLLIMDEPTSSLTQAEAERLFAVVEDLRAQGLSVVYISHRLSEVERLADRVVVLRDGRNAGELRGDDICHARMVGLMVGRDVERFYQRAAHTPGAVVLEVRGLRSDAWPQHDVDLQVRAGEIVGLAGLVGAGRSELLGCLFGVRRPRAGQVRVGGQLVPLGAPRAALEAGMALVPEDRKEQGVVLDLGVDANISLASLHRRARGGVFVATAAERQLAQSTVQQLGVKTPHLVQPVRYLSGGNQQKVVLGKWLALGPAVLLLDEPTRGIDVGAKAEIYALLHQLAGRGMAVLLASSEMEEVMGVCDRVMVMHEGRIVGELPRSACSEQAILRLATGRSAEGRRDQAGTLEGTVTETS